MIIQVQALTRIIDGKDYDFIESNGLTKEMFLGYEEEFQFIVDHYRQFGNIPDDYTFQNRFRDFEFFEVTETDDFIVKKLKESVYLPQSTALSNKFNQMLKDNLFDALNYINTESSRILSNYNVADVHSIDIISSSKDRFEQSENVSNKAEEWFIPTGFDELDADIRGFQRHDELVVLFARTNQGKSWIAEKIASYMSEYGLRVGYFSPEMSTIDLGYRFDTLHGHLSNNAMRLGRFNDEFSIDDYRSYCETLSKLTGKLFITRPKDFNRKVTVSNLKRWVRSDNLQALFIDGITYLTDERYKRGDSKTISLTNISEDLMELSAEMKLPIIIVVQANRGGVVDKQSTDTPELENIRDSDGIAQNASIVYAIRQIRSANGKTYLVLDNKKMRGGEVGKSYTYEWDIDRGEFILADKSEISQSKGDVQKEEKELSAGRNVRRKRNAEEDF